jgi:hypothetical protein
MTKQVLPRQLFVVATGRSGTRTLADFLSSVPGCTVIHEQDPPLLEEVVAFQEGRLPYDEVVALLRRTRSPEVLGGERVSGESNQRLSFVMPALVDAFPNARFIWLIRDARTAVPSMVQRLGYHPQEIELREPATKSWASTRVRGDVVGDMGPDEWARLDGFGRCCWYWAYTNRLIETELGRLGVESLRVKLEELSERWPEISALLGLTGEPAPAVPHSNRARGKPLCWRHWSRSQQRVFERVCGATMDLHYPQWREEFERGPSAEVRALSVRSGRRVRGALLVKSRPLRARFGLVRKRRPTHRQKPLGGGGRA